MSASGDDLRLGSTDDPSARYVVEAGTDEQATGAFPLHAVREGSDHAVCGAPVRTLAAGRWPASQEARCLACEEALGG